MNENIDDKKRIIVTQAGDKFDALDHMISTHCEEEDLYLFQKDLRIILNKHIWI